MAAKAKTQGTAVAAPEKNPAPSIIQRPGIVQADEAMLAEMEGVQGVGYSTNAADRGTPFLYIAQKSSKTVNPKKPEYIEGLEVGNSYNNVTGEQWDTENTPLPFIPCFFKAVYNEWTPVDQGGGFHGQHPIDTPLLNGAIPVLGADGNPRRDVLTLENGHELVLTHEYWSLLPESWSAIIIAMSSSNLGASKKMQGLIGAQKVQTSQGVVVKPSYFTTFSLRTAYAENDSGDWYKFVPKVDGPTEDVSLRAACKELALACIRGETKSAEQGDVDRSKQPNNDGSAID